MDDVRSIAIPDLEEFCTQVFIAQGVAPEQAKLLAAIAVEADLRGHDSHGVRLVLAYKTTTHGGSVNAQAAIRVIRETPVSVLVDADGGYGPVAMTLGLEHCLQKVATTGVALAGVRNSNHLFIPAHYVLRAARAGYLALCTAVAKPILAPTGGLGRVLGNNPWAFGIPAGQRAPIVLDIAPSASFAKVRMYAEERRPLPAGWALDQDGNPTTEAEAALLGSLLPLGEHKGYGLAMVSEILGAVLTGAGYGPASGADGQVGHFLLVFDPGLLMPPAEFAQRIEDHIRRIKATPRQAGVPEIFYPGERAARLEQAARAQGTHRLVRSVWEPLQALAQTLNLPLPLHQV